MLAKGRKEPALGLEHLQGAPDPQADPRGQGHAAPVPPSRATGRLSVSPAASPARSAGAAALTTSGVQARVCGAVRTRRGRTAFRKLWRTPNTRSLSSSGGKAEGDESWGMTLPPTCFTTPCKR